MNKCNEIDAYLERFQLMQLETETFLMLADANEKRAKRLWDGSGTISEKEIYDLIMDMVNDDRERVDKIRKQAKVIEDAIDSVDDPLYRDILHLYYIDGLTLEKVADKVCYSQKHIYKLREKACERLMQSTGCNLLESSTPLRVDISQEA